jgi:hypothetical protein
VGPPIPESGIEPFGPGPVRRLSESPRPVKQPADSPHLVRRLSDSPGPVKHLSAFQLEQIRLVGGREVSALLIPADRSRPIAKTKFDLDKIHRYDAVSYDRDRVFLTKKRAYLDHGWNPHATEYVKHHSDAAKDPDSRLPIPGKLYGDVIVLSRDWVMDHRQYETAQRTEARPGVEAPLQSIRVTPSHSAVRRGHLRLSALTRREDARSRQRPPTGEEGPQI